jgi:hypothetical protein
MLEKVLSVTKFTTRKESWIEWTNEASTLGNVSRVDFPFFYLVLEGVLYEARFWE